jgi:hypothetical protein
MMMQYLSKWRNEWIDFTPTEGQLFEILDNIYEDCAKDKTATFQVPK